MTASQKTAATKAALEVIKKLMEEAPPYGSVGAEFHFKAGALIRTSTNTEKTELVGEVTDGR